MKLITALNIGRDCGLETVSEAILNIDMHAICIFRYEEIPEEMNELETEYINSGYSKDTKIIDIIGGR